MHDAFIERVLTIAEQICWKRTGQTLAEITADKPQGWKWRMLLQIRQWYGYAPGDVAVNVLWLVGAGEEYLPEVGAA